MASSMDTPTMQLVRETWEPVYELGMDGALLLYSNMFEVDPAIRVLFASSDVKKQAVRLFKMINLAVEQLDDLPTLLSVLKDLGRRHVGYGIKPQHFDAVEGALCMTLETALGDAWNDQVKVAWVKVYNTLVGAMKEGALQDPDAVALGY